MSFRSEIVILTVNRSPVSYMIRLVVQWRDITLSVCNVLNIVLTV